MNNLAVAAAVAALAGVGIASSAQAGECYHAGGSATMVTRGLAEFMANAALKNSIAGHGWTPSGPIRMVCKDDNMLTTSCTARRLACK